jgi:hypothetical protein
VALSDSDWAGRKIRRVDFQRFVNLFAGGLLFVLQIQNIAVYLSNKTTIKTHSHEHSNTPND